MSVRLFLSFVVALLLAPVPARSAVLIHLSFDEMSEKSSAILVGRCVEVRSALAEPFGVVTHNVFEVREYYKGGLGRRVTITEPGGQVGNMVAEYSGFPRFRVGEEAVLFVWTDPQGSHQVIGLTQGKFNLRQDSRTGETTLQQASSHEPMLEPDAHAGEAPAQSLAIPMTGFRSRVTAALQRAAALKARGTRQ